MNEFDEKALTWDDDPVRVERASAIADSMRKVLDMRGYRSALEYGSGTGLLSFALKDDLEDVTLMDASKGMIKVTMDKCRIHGIKHLHPVLADLVKDEYHPKVKHDLIFILLTLHHVEDIPSLLSKFKRIMSAGGDLVIIDLEKEDGSFHEDEFHGHFGFEKTELGPLLVQSGFDPYHYEVCFEIEKGEGDNSKKYPMFILLAKA